MHPVKKSPSSSSPSYQRIITINGRNTNVPSPPSDNHSTPDQVGRYWPITTPENSLARPQTRERFDSDTKPSSPPIRIPAPAALISSHLKAAAWEFHRPQATRPHQPTQSVLQEAPPITTHPEEDAVEEENDFSLVFSQSP